MSSTRPARGSPPHSHPRTHFLKPYCVLNASLGSLPNMPMARGEDPNPTMHTLAAQSCCRLIKLPIKCRLQSARTCNFWCKHVLQEQGRQSACSVYRQHHKGSKHQLCTARFQPATSVATMLRGVDAGFNPPFFLSTTKAHHSFSPETIFPAWARFTLLVPTSCLLPPLPRKCTALLTSFRVVMNLDVSLLSEAFRSVCCPQHVSFLSR